MVLKKGKYTATPNTSKTLLHAVKTLTSHVPSLRITYPAENPESSVREMDRCGLQCGYLGHV